MELTFLRNQLNLKLVEFQLLASKYIEDLEKELNALKEIATQEQKNKMVELFIDLKTCSTDASEIQENFEIAVLQLQQIYADIISVYKMSLEEKKKILTSTFEEITITRQPLRYSTFAESVGYNSEKNLLDISYTTGGIYRYYSVPQDFYDLILFRKSFKGFKNEISKFDSKKIS